MFDFCLKISFHASTIHSHKFRTLVLKHPIPYIKYVKASPEPPLQIPNRTHKNRYGRFYGSSDGLRDCQRRQDIKKYMYRRVVVGWGGVGGRACPLGRSFLERPNELQTPARYQRMLRIHEGQGSSFKWPPSRAPPAKLQYLQFYLPRFLVAKAPTFYCLDIVIADYESCFAAFQPPRRRKPASPARHCCEIYFRLIPLSFLSESLE